MLTLTFLVHCPEKQAFQEVLTAALAFLHSCPPKRREHLRFCLEDPPLASMQVLEKAREMGLETHFRIVHEKDACYGKEAEREAQVLVLGGKASDSWIMDHVCRQGRTLIRYEFRSLEQGKKSPPWCLDVAGTHRDDREALLVQQLRKLFDDPSALSWMRRQSLDHYHRHCNQVTRRNLLMAMGGQEPAQRGLRP